MATLFLSYKAEDRNHAAKLKKELEALKHEVRWDENVLGAGSQFRAALTEALVRSDGVVALLTENALRSPFVLGEIGAARALYQTKGMLLFPIVVGSSVPEVVSDLNLVSIPKLGVVALRSAAKKVNRAIQARNGSPRIFISHRHKDRKIAAALVSLLEEAFEVGQKDLRCTSVQPYTLSIGARTSDRLRAEIRNAEVVLGVISPETTESDYVLAELGAAWGLEVPTFPLLAGGASANQVPAPLDELNCVALTDSKACLQLVDELRAKTTLTSRQGPGARLLREVEGLTAAAGTGP